MINDKNEHITTQYEDLSRCFRSVFEKNFSSESRHSPKFDFILLYDSSDKNLGNTSVTPYIIIKNDKDISKKTSHSSVKYWNSLLDEYDELLKRNRNCSKKREGLDNDIRDWLKLFRAVLYGTINHGEFFQYNLSQHLPENLVYSEEEKSEPEEDFILSFWEYLGEELLREVEKLNYKEVPKLEQHLSLLKDYFDRYEAGIGLTSYILKDQTNRYKLGSKLAKQSQTGQTQYCTALSKHTWSLLHLYQDVENKELEKDSKISLGGNCEEEMLEGIFVIFRQFVSILTEVEQDSGLKNFLEEFSCSKSRQLIKTNVKLILESIIGSKLALSVLPAYLTLVFNTYRAKFSKEKVNEFQSLPILLKETSFPTMKKKIFCHCSGAEYSPKPPTKARKSQECQIILYQLLRNFLQMQETKHEIQLFSREQSDIILQLQINIVGLSYFSITERHMNLILSQEKIYLFNDFHATVEWVHPVLEMMSKRIKSQFTFLPERLPQIIEDNLCNSFSDLPDLNKKISANKQVFYQEYKRLLFEGEKNLSEEPATKDSLVALASLMDEIMLKSDIRIFNYDTFQTAKAPTHDEVRRPTEDTLHPNQSAFDVHGDTTNSTSFATLADADCSDLEDDELDDVDCSDLEDDELDDADCSDPEDDELDDVDCSDLEDDELDDADCSDLEDDEVDEVMKFSEKERRGTYELISSLYEARRIRNQDTVKEKHEKELQLAQMHHQLYQVQQKIHEIYAKDVKGEYYVKIMTFLRKYLYSPEYFHWCSSLDDYVITTYAWSRNTEPFNN